MLGFAFLLPFLTWIQAAGAAVLALLFNAFLLPCMDLDLAKKDGTEPELGGVESGVESQRPNPEGTMALTGSAPPASSSYFWATHPQIWRGILLYPISVLGLVFIYRHHLEIVGAAWAIMALGDGAAGVMGEALRGPRLPWNRRKTWSGFLAFVIAGTPGAYVLARWINPALPEDKAWAVSLLAALVGAIVETLPIGLDDNVSVPLVTGAFLFCAYQVRCEALASNLPYLRQRVLLAIAVNLVLALLALALKTVTPSGAAMGVVLGIAVYMGYGWKSFALLLAFFVIGSAATRLGYESKSARAIAEHRGGKRSWREAVANLLAGAFFAVLMITTPREAAFLVALVATFAEAAGDTVSSEIGQWLGRRAWLIITLKPVPAGENGGVSLVGTLAGALASTLIVVLGLGLGLVNIRNAAVVLGAAIAGNLFDSVLGATLERRGLVTNGIVNFAGTSFAGALALAACM
jgi:uncharacterized protein (TIGR00297 family)